MKKFIPPLLLIILIIFIAIPIVLIPTGCPLNKTSTTPIYSIAVQFEDNVSFDKESKTLQFGLVKAESGENTVAGEITNSGNTPLTLNELLLENTIHYKLGPLTLPLRLKSGESIKFSITFNPQDSGTQGTTLTINYTSDRAESEQISLIGEGNYAPSAQFGIEVSGATNYPGVNGFYLKQESTHNLHPLYKKSDSPDYYIYFFSPDGNFWGIDTTFNEDYPWYDGELAQVHGPLCYIGSLDGSGLYPPEFEEQSSSKWVENYTSTPQITVKTGITRDTVAGVLRANYRYNDPEGDKESETTFKWYKSDTVDGVYTEIAGATTNEYILDPTVDNDKYFKLEITVTDDRGMTGDSVTSDPYYVEPSQLLANNQGVITSPKL